MEYFTTKEAAEKWKISIRQVQNHCKNGRIPGVQKFGNSYMIPKDTPKPKYMFVCSPEQPK
ncbi:helix-turn-helix domain-containing protein [Caproiciproducens galactitolivorans]|uniref:Helix-turn-helix domain-containing protein n=1 Tax=Caproiciproducens galactitolivorans TaxID=642589 RepID=A0ABT4BVV9_9FIRM|nr:helix-turn-helix domain-containing protein [Caproiciproducens galactitolivorans]MCY1714915.1 helix-turn-helix domain-containing protein [Caproiciproducens galactitolivorans]